MTNYHLTLFGDAVGDAHSSVYHEQLRVIEEQAFSNVWKNQKMLNDIDVITHLAVEG